MSIELKVGIVKENEEIIGAFVMIVPDNGIPMMLGGVDEPLEIQIMTKDALVRGLNGLPQDFLHTINQCSVYEPQNVEELQDRFMELIE